MRSFNRTTLPYTCAVTVNGLLKCSFREVFGQQNRVRQFFRGAFGWQNVPPDPLEMALGWQNAPPDLLEMAFGWQKCFS
jgi:hypothetical protein